MPSVDNRVVKMEFDNASFERKIASTIASLDKLKHSLEFKGGAKSFTDITAAANKFSLSGISDGIEGVSKKFIALSTIAITALAQITTAALRAGANLVKSFSFGPVLEGFQEFELNMNSIQTILANTKADGTNLEQVNAALDQLNEYSDKTIYNFAQMARNIGTFTAAGVDLDTSVSAIKGIANLAAISGSSSEQASTAMYQLSQAISTGTLRLMDWNSVVNAGMGGEVFQRALFETGKAMGKLTDVPVDQTFDQWRDAGNSFRDSLQEEWLTAEVLTTTLGGISGELTEADLAAKGFSQSQAAALVELGQLGVEAATKVRTFTQLMSTVRESVASGWSASFRLLIGNFEESTKLFTGISDAMGGFIQRSSDARNAVLQDWVNLGGRMVVIEALRKLFINLGKVLAPIKEAFRELFPPITGKRLFELSQGFLKLVEALEPSEGVINVIKAVFTAFFSVLKIGWTIIKEGIKFIASLFGAFGGVDTGKISELATKFTDFFKGLTESLTKGEGIKNFFKDLADTIKDIPNLLRGLKDSFFGLFDGLDPKVPDVVGDSMGRLGQRFDGLRTLFGKVADLWQPFIDAMGKIFEVLDNIWTGIRDWFSQLGQRIADNMDEGDFDAVMDALNVALLGGIAALLARFLKKGFKFDIGSGLFDQIGQSFESLTGVLTAMQTNIKADALLKIAGAIAILTASVLVLSLIDSAALTKALSAMAVGFSQLLGAFAILSKLNLGPTSAVSFGILAAGMTVLAVAVLALSFAVKNMAGLDWNELAKGLTGVTVLLAALSIAAKPLAANSAGMLSAGLALIPMALALIILGKAVEVFAEMEWGEMIQGLIGVVGGIIGLGAAMRLFPQNLALSGIGLLLISLSLDKIAAAVEKFSTFSWGEIVKGTTAMALALAGIGLAMNLMPTNMPLTAAGLFILSLALGRIKDSVQGFANMEWGEIARGLVGLAGTLLVLALAMNAMSGTLGGAIAIGVAALSLGVLLKVLEEFSKVKFGELFHGLAAMGIALAAIGIAAFALQPVLPALFLLGAALLLLGAGFALFGVGAIAVAKAFELFAKVGPKGAEAFTNAMKTMAKAIPQFLGAVAEGVVEFFATIADLAPQLAESLRIILESVIDELIKLIPKLKELLSTLLTNIIDLLREKIPEYAIMGMDIILAILQGIRDHIGEIVTVVGEIIVAFLDALATQIPLVVSAGVDVWVAAITAIAEGVGRVASTLMVGVAAAFIRGFMQGLQDNIPGPMRFFRELPGKVLGWIGSVLSTLTQKGLDIISGFWNGITQQTKVVTTFFQNLGKSIGGWIGSLASTIKNKGFELIVGFWNGIQDRITGVINWFGGLGKRILDALGDIGDILVSVGKAIIEGLKRGASNAWGAVSSWFKDRANDIKNFFTNPLSIFSPSRFMAWVGRMIFAGLQDGMEKEWKTTSKWLDNLNIAERIDGDGINKSLQKVLDSAVASMADMDSAKPIITPVLDLTEIMAGATQIQGIFASPTINPTTALSTARQISFASTPTATDDSSVSNGGGDVIYNQTVNSPTRLSTADVYRQTRNLLRVQKEELSIP